MTAQGGVTPTGPVPRVFAAVAPNVSAQVLQTAAGAGARESFGRGVACDAAIGARLTSLATIED